MKMSLVFLLALSTLAWAADLTGKWSGTMEELDPQGNVIHTGGAFMDLKLSGTTVTGTAGPSETEQNPIENGKLDGKKLTFEVTGSSAPIAFDLIVDSDVIQGKMSSHADGRDRSARLNLKRLSAPPGGDDRAADRAAIKAHIDRIFQAFIHQDAAELRATHAQNWLGYLEGSRTMVRGLDGYMDHSGHFDPSGAYRMTGYKLREFDMVFHGDAAFVAFVADVDSKTPDGPYHRTLRITDFYTKQNGAWIQNGSDTDLHPESVEAQAAMPRELYGDQQQQLFAAREAVWRAYFAGDRAALEKLLPQDLVAIEPGGGWSNRRTVLEGSARFAASGGKLVRLEFPKTEIQAYGSTAILYSKYVYEIEQGGKRSVESGRATEVFVRRNGQWLNPSWHMDTVN